MSYSTGEALLAGIVAGVTGLSSAQVRRGDYSALNRGGAAQYAILAQAAQPETNWQSAACYTLDCVCNVEIWQRYKDDGSTYTNLLTLTDAVLAKINTYRRLNDNTGAIITATALPGLPPEEMWNASGGPHWLRIVLPVTWQELVRVTFA